MCNCFFTTKVSTYNANLIGKTLYGEITTILDGATLIIKIHYGDEDIYLRSVLNKCERFSYNYLTKEKGYLKKKKQKKYQPIETYDCSNSDYYSKTTNMFISVLRNTPYFSLELPDLESINKKLSIEPIKCHINIIGHSNDYYIIYLYNSLNLKLSVNDMMLDKIF
jgi:hypothetical protein